MEEVKRKMRADNERYIKRQDRVVERINREDRERYDKKRFTSIYIFLCCLLMKVKVDREK